MMPGALRYHFSKSHTVTHFLNVCFLFLLAELCCWGALGPQGKPFHQRAQHSKLCERRPLLNYLGYLRRATTGSGKDSD